MNPGTVGSLVLLAFLGFFFMLCALRTTKLVWFIIFAIWAAACFALVYGISIIVV